MKNLLTKILFILSLSSAVIPSGVQAAVVKKVTKGVLQETSVKEKIALGSIVVLVAVKMLVDLLVPARPSRNTINGKGPLPRTATRPSRNTYHGKELLPGTK